MSLISFYVEVLNALNKANVPYMMVGAFAATRYGLNRATYDVDIIVDFKEGN